MRKRRDSLPLPHLKTLFSFFYLDVGGGDIFDAKPFHFIALFNGVGIAINGDQSHHHAIGFVLNSPQILYLLLRFDFRYHQL